MRYFIFIFLLLFSFELRSEIYFQDPTGNSLNEFYKTLSKEDLINISSPDKAKKLYLKGILYLNGDDGFDIKKNCTSAVESFKSALDMGAIDAEFTLATMYYGGVCVARDFSKAKYYLNKSAEAGYLLSQRMLGRAYWGCARCQLKNIYFKSIDKAIYWMSKGALAGDRQSAAALSIIYQEGDGVEIDLEKAFQWRYRAAHSEKYFSGETMDFRALAEFYEKGIGTEVDLVQAYKYYDLRGTAGGSGKVRIRPKMTQDQIDEALRLSREWQEEHNVQVGGGWIQFN